jgi:type IV pilus assembly protein PilA
MMMHCRWRLFIVRALHHCNVVLHSTDMGELMKTLSHIKSYFVRGFTLVELMIVIAIIAVLATFAIPQYQDYTARAQASEAFTLLDGAKIALLDQLAMSGNRCPDNREAQGVQGGDFPGASAFSGRYVESMTLGGEYDQRAANGRGCEIVAKFKSNQIAGPIAGKSIRFVVENHGAALSFVCTTGKGTTVPVRYLPKTCVAIDEVAAS